MELQRDEYSVMSFNPETQALELWWSAGTASLTEERFRRGLEELAGHAVEHRAPNLLVDLREFAYRPAPDMGDWRLEHIIPRYREAGVRKFANIVPEGWSLGETTNEQEGFPTRNVRTVEEAEAWSAKPDALAPQPSQPASVRQFSLRCQIRYATPPSGICNPYVSARNTNTAAVTWAWNTASGTSV